MTATCRLWNSWFDSGGPKASPLDVLCPVVNDSQVLSFVMVTSCRLSHRCSDVHDGLWLSKQPSLLNPKSQARRNEECGPSTVTAYGVGSFSSAAVMVPLGLLLSILHPSPDPRSRNPICRPTAERHEPFHKQRTTLIQQGQDAGHQTIRKPFLATLSSPQRVTSASNEH